MSDRYTAITFSPVQGFIEKSRKLRDLYGSSFILSHLANQICLEAREYLSAGSDNFPNPIISPAMINVAQGTPNQIIIRGEFPRSQAQTALTNAWKQLVVSCQQWIQNNVEETESGERIKYFWDRPWKEWINHNWEFFWATGNTIDQARHNLNQQKTARAWTGINYVGESSTLSGLDSRAWPALGRHAPHTHAKADEEAEVKAFYRLLSAALDSKGATIDEREQLSIPELVKRLVTINEVVDHNVGVEKPRSYKGLRRWKDSNATISEDAERDERWTGWFQGDGDRAGHYLQQASREPGADPEGVLHRFSLALRQWGSGLDNKLPLSSGGNQPRHKDGRIVYAGGDDFLGVLYRNEPRPKLTPQECLNWFYRFKPDVWNEHGQAITVSIGFVWVSPQVPQRDVLQHCRMAESSAKENGRDRIALRILFSGGNYLEWHCPWRFLRLLEDYERGGGRSGEAPNWTHIYRDVAALEARHAFRGQQSEIAWALLKVYFQGEAVEKSEKDEDMQALHNFLKADSIDIDSAVLWNQYEGDSPYDFQGKHLSTGILGERSAFTKAGELDPDRVHAAFTAWVIDLAKVGFHLCSNT
ncbi:MAG: CRISPR-associated protein [Phormidesmis priestleyi]|uniref:CRISPR-associated protein n=1 Tax=Phormidesmis priestleyi TaxID=268141 RepID=A0A2W4Z578_9CYAN|nr:MAG: CRISPR-associated protein [Phormidesmis priestleyi]